MDNKYISEILSIIKNSDIQLKEIEIRGVKYNDDVSDRSTLYIETVERIGFGASLSKSWIIESQLIFLLFDGYLEDMYSLDEGSSFKSRYENLPIASDMEIIKKNCYRIMKIFRNAVTHNLSHIVVDESGYKIGYTNKKNQSIRLDITNDSVQILYTLIVAFVIGDIEIHTAGHYEGILLSYYKNMLNGISVLEDELGNSLIPLKNTFVELNTSVRYRVLNPRIIYEDEVLKIKKYYPGSAEYACDYFITHGEDTFLVPEEIMMPAEEFLILRKSELGEKWKIDKKYKTEFAT